MNVQNLTVSVRGGMKLLAVTALGASLVLMPGTAGAQPATLGGHSGPAGQCYDRTAQTTYEETRIDTPALPGGDQVPTKLIEVGGFTPVVEQFTRDLCDVRSVKEADKLLQSRGAALWRTAVERAQGKRWMGSIERYDDRPLYWSRLTATRDLRQWTPRFALTDTARASLIKTYEYASRGIASTDFSTSKNVTRVLVSGFDPYQLNGEIRRSNPSGASALQLDGQEYQVGDRTVQIQAVSLPVTWSGFDLGYVEDTFGPHLTSNSKERADLIMTISQGGRGRMAIEQWAAAWRGGSADNNNEGTPELVPQVTNWPQPQSDPEFIETTLPYQQMVDAGTTPWPVALNPRICEWTGNTRPDPTKLSCHDNGPSADAQSQSGGGGNYLSNESMYRSNRLRTAIGATDVPGGHLHISSLVYPQNPLAIIDTAFASDRAQTIEQTVALVKAAGAAVS